MSRVIDLFSVQPVDRRELAVAARESGGIVLTVEDHYQHGGIGDVVFSALATEGVRGNKLAVREIPRSGKPAELLQLFGIDADHIVSAILDLLSESAVPSQHRPGSLRLANLISVE